MKPKRRGITMFNRASSVSSGQAAKPALRGIGVVRRGGLALKPRYPMADDAATYAAVAQVQTTSKPQFKTGKGRKADGSDLSDARATVGVINARAVFGLRAR